MNWKKVYPSFLFTACLLLLASLLGHVVLGAQMRYSGDDYCYASVVAQHGFLQAQVYSYLHEFDFHGNRFSLNLFSGIADILGPRFNGILPGLVIFLSLLSTTFLVYQASRLRRKPIRVLEASLVGSLLTVFLLATLPDLTQVLYWRSGMLPYLAPVVTTSLLLGLLIERAQAGSSSWFSLVVVFFLALLSGGFSETGAALQAGMLGFFSLSALIARWRRGLWGRSAFLPLTVAWLGTILSISLLLLSPSLAFRTDNLSNPAGFLGSLSSSAFYAYQFIYISIRSLVLPYFLLAASAFTLAYLSTSNRPSTIRLSLLRFAFAFLALGFCTYLLILACMVPSAYGQASYPSSRALVEPHWALVIAIFIGSWMVGELVAEESRKISWLVIVAPWGATLLLLGLSLYPLRWLPGVLVDLPKYQKWAVLWDARDQEIRQASQQGKREVEVMLLDHVISDVAELTTSPNNWYTVCAERYYGVSSIKADLPGWDR